jgi:hypothetical protein
MPVLHYISEVWGEKLSRRIQGLDDKYQLEWKQLLLGYL